jgi:tetratricopeptide (TPR) repeat protein
MKRHCIQFILCPGRLLVTPSVLAIWFASLSIPFARADDAPFYQQQPYDTIKLDAANRNVELKVRLLDLPGRLIPAKPDPSDELEIHLLDRPRKVYKVAWEHVVEVKLFEQRVLDEAEALVESKKLDDAYPFYEFLEHRFPTMAGLAESYNKFLMAGTKEAFQQEKYEEALALLWELHSRVPEFSGASTGILRLLAKLIDRRFAEEDYTAARGLLREATDRLKDRAQPLAATWDEKLHGKAAALVAKAREQVAARQFSEASRTMRQALSAWPEVAGGKELVQAIQSQYPEVVVGVTSLPPPGIAATDSWEGRRDRRLLFESNAHAKSQSEIRRGLSPFAESSEQKGTVPLSAGGSRIGSEPTDAGANAHGPYRVESANSNEIRFAAVEGYFAAGGKQPKQIVERRFPDVASALRALRRGEITAVDRIGPWDAAALANSERFVVQPYMVTSLHVLVPNLRRPLMNDPTFRRAVAHAMDRSGILIDQLSRGKLQAGCELTDRLIAGPGSAAADGSAELRFDPGAAKLLAGLSLAQFTESAHGSGDRTAIPSTELTLAHPADEVARLGCQAIGQELRAAGMSLKLKEMSAGDMSAGSSDADLIYVEWTPLDPLAELPRLIGRRGLGGDAGPLVERRLRDALAARPDRAGERTGQLEEIIREQALAIPLWRLSNYAAYQRGLEGIGGRPLTLYQNIEQWSLTTAGSNE